MADHALLSASSAHRWLECLPSARLEEKLPPQTSEYAEEGTLAHEIAYWTARNAVLQDCSFEECDEALLKCHKHPLFSGEMLEHANAYTAVVFAAMSRAQATCKDPVCALEVRLDYSEWVPEGFGTGDCVVIGDKYIEIIDYKYGRGVPVSAVRNPQMMLYALGAYAKFSAMYDLDTVRMTIVQPRINNTSTDVISVSELRAWGEFIVAPRAVKAFKGEGDYMPGEEQCRFCRAGGICRARAKRNLDLFDAQATENMTPDDVGAVLKRAADIPNWIKALEAEVQCALLSGKQVPGWKIVEGRSVRRFADEKAVIQKMNAAGFKEPLLFERKLLSLAQMEKAFGKKLVDDILADVIEKPEGAPTLAPDTDKRPAFTPKDQLIKKFEEDE